MTAEPPRIFTPYAYANRFDDQPVSGGLEAVLKRGVKEDLDEKNHVEMVARLMTETETRT